MKHISNFSGGLCSFFSTMRSIERHGKENVIPLFADTLYEDPDLYDFNRRAEEIMGIPITRICVGMTPWQLFQSEGLIGNDRFPICSTKLKREPLNAWMDAHYEMDLNQLNMLKEHAAIVLGFDFSEFHRVVDFQNQHPTWTVEAPMTEAPLWDKCRMISEAEKLGFKTAELYALGFPHNNCGGECVKGGISHWVQMLRLRPKRFNQSECEELRTQQIFRERGISNWQYTILKDRRNGTTRPLTLQSLRLRVEAGEEFPKDEWGGCGCGGSTEPKQ